MSLNQGMLRTTMRAGLFVGLAILSGAAFHWLWPVETLHAAAPPASTPSPGPEMTINEVGGKSLKEWKDELKSFDPSVREEAIRAIPLFGPAALDAVPALAEHINDLDASPREKSILALGMIHSMSPIEGKDRDKIVKMLGERLDGNESQGPIRYDIALVLMMFGKDSKAALPGLIHGAGDTSCWEVRRICLAALAQAGQTDDMHGPDRRATQCLLTALNVDERAAAVRLQAVMTMAQLGKPMDQGLLAEELSTVRRMMKDKDKTVAIWAHLSMMALDNIDKPDIDYLTIASKPTEIERVRTQAIGALGMVATKKDEVIPTLVDYLSETKSPVIVAAACQALGGIKDPGAKAKASLVAIAVSKDEKIDQNVRIAAIYALSRIAGEDKSMVATLVALLADSDPTIVTTSCHAIGLIKEPGAAAEQAITELSQNQKVAVSIREYAQKVHEAMAKPNAH
ncbi:MAG TPA: HEAT repeat domain-containing protein [Gemmataceae bacterium]|nr:HEAT repeat domain-containing protein [Gemmataceae bacterium]